MENIRLIVTDLDGTLLDNEGQIPVGFSAYVKELKDLGIELMLASGRPLYTIRNTFKQYKNDIIISGDNGATVDFKGSKFKIDSLSKDELKELLDYSRKFETAVVVFFGSESTILFEESKTMTLLPDEFFGPIKYIRNIDELDDEIVKFSLNILDKSGKSIYFDDLLPTFKGRYSVSYGDESWVDVMKLNVNKGEALKKVAEHLSIDLENVMVFGNALNDKEMLEAVEYSYVVDNAFSEVIEYANYKTDSNIDLGVFKIIDMVIKKHENMRSI